jgi:hypothetical protein
MKLEVFYMVCVMAINPLSMRMISPKALLLWQRSEDIRSFNLATQEGLAEC